MDDSRIIELYFARDERAIEATDAKYGKLLYRVAYNILYSNEDSEECVNDTYMKAWGAMPPEKPNILSAFLAKITRNLSINRYLQNKARKRMILSDMVFEEIGDCIPDTKGPVSDDIDLRDAINGFLASLPESTRLIFVKRYFYMMSIKEICVDMRTSESNVKVSLMRSRNRFKAYLEKAGISI
jgi:RNA polymerase sigma-70 factor (ECF subfamily)